MALFGRVTLLSIVIFGFLVTFWTTAANQLFTWAEAVVAGFERMFNTSQRGMNSLYDYGLIPITALFLLIAAFLFVAFIAHLIGKKK